MNPDDDYRLNIHLTKHEINLLHDLKEMLGCPSKTATIKACLKIAKNFYSELYQIPVRDLTIEQRMLLLEARVDGISIRQEGKR